MLFTERLLAYNQPLTTSEQRLVDAVLENYPHGLLESATAIASQFETSASTVVRLFAKLGYSSYSEAQLEARHEVASRLQTAAQRVPLSIGRNRTLTECIDETLAIDQQNIQRTREAVNIKEFSAVVKGLTSARGRIFVVAQKNSAPVGAYLSTHLTMCLPRVQSLTGNTVQVAEELIWIDPADILLVFTVRRYAKVPLTAAEYFRKCGAKVFAITDSPTSPVAQIADHNLFVNTANASPFNSYTAALFLCNSLISAVAQGQSSQVEDALVRRDELWCFFESEIIKSGRAE